MVTVEVTSIAPGRCIWCGKEKSQVVTVAFSDKSFSGPMCFGDFKKALTMKVGASESGQPAKHAAPAAIPVKLPDLTVGASDRALRDRNSGTPP